MKRENKELRLMLAMCYTKGRGYFDDGEMQDNTRRPFIDFKRDSVPVLKCKFRKRGEDLLKEVKAEIEPDTLRVTTERERELVAVLKDILPHLRQGTIWVGGRIRENALRALGFKFTDVTPDLGRQQEWIVEANRLASKGQQLVEE